jgi:hypothetical protein
MTIRVANANIVTAFDSEAIGSRVLSEAEFLAYLTGAIRRYDSSGDRVAGQHFVVLPKEAYGTVSAGDGPKSDNPEDYVIRMHRGQPGMYLKREKAGPVNFLACVVYTFEAYCADPEVDDQEAKELAVLSPTHVLVAVIASSGPSSPLPPWRFVCNLAGGNKEALVWSADEIRAKAAEIKEYWSQWSVVAD